MEHETLLFPPPSGLFYCQQVLSDLFASDVLGSAQRATCIHRPMRHATFAVFGGNVLESAQFSLVYLDLLCRITMAYINILQDHSSLCYSTMVVRRTFRRSSCTIRDPPLHASVHRHSHWLSLIQEIVSIGCLYLTLHQCCFSCPRIFKISSSPSTLH